MPKSNKDQSNPEDPAPHKIAHVTIAAPYIQGFRLHPGKLWLTLPENARFLSASGTPEDCILYYLLQYHDAPGTGDTDYLREKLFAWVDAERPLPPWVMDCPCRLASGGRHLFEIPAWTEPLAESPLEPGPAARAVQHLN